MNSKYFESCLLEIYKTDYKTLIILCGSYQFTIRVIDIKKNPYMKDYKDGKLERQKDIKKDN